ncbi:MAG TPA: helix-turn-helix domain-containing protein [Solirubrobacteraceae bacterium]|jgi:AcrR family transcriptional regulator|nr:helix-turn-helix domain-containing protein [Solirubrobacteraceae bacterium]
MPAASTLKAPRFDRTATAILAAAARVFSEQGSAANLGEVAAGAGVSRATLYRYYPNREALLDALAAHALTELASRLNDAGLERATAEEAVERLARAIVAVGDRYAVLSSEQCKPNAADAERLIGAPIRAVFERGIAAGRIRQDLPVDVLVQLFAGTIMAAIKLTQREQLGHEEASAAAAAVFLDGVRPR